MDPAKRTKIMLEAFRRKVVAHEQMSRANEGRNQFSLREKLAMALPLVAIVITLFTASFKFTAYKSRLFKEAQAREAPKEEDQESSSFRDYIFGDQHDEDGELNLNETDKKW